MNAKWLIAVRLSELILVLLVGVPVLFPATLIPFTWHPYLLIVLLLSGPLGIFSACTQWFGASGIEGFQLLWQPSSPLTRLHAALLCILAIGLGISSDQKQSLIVTGYILLGIALYAALLRLPNKFNSANHIGWMLLLCGIGLTAVAPFTLLWRSESRIFNSAAIVLLLPIQARLGETIHPNVMAGALVITLPISIAFLLQNRDKDSHARFVFHLMVTLLMTLVLILTQSRGGLFALVGAILLMVLLLDRRLAVAIILCVFVVVLGIWVSGPRTLLDQLSADGSLGGLQGRLAIWQNSLYAIADFPFTGIGTGTFVKVMSLLYPLESTLTVYPHAHNLLLQIGVDIGLPGLIVYLAILLNLITMLAFVLHSNLTTSRQYILAVGAVGSLSGILLHGLLDAVTWGTKLAFLPWVLFVLITQLFLSTQQDTRFLQKDPID